MSDYLCGVATHGTEADLCPLPWHAVDTLVLPRYGLIVQLPAVSCPTVLDEPTPPAP